MGAGGSVLLTRREAQSSTSALSDSRQGYFRGLAPRAGEGSLHTWWTLTCTTEMCP